VVALDTLDSGVEITDFCELGPNGKAVVKIVASEVCGRIIDTLVITVVVITTTGEDPDTDVWFRVGAWSV